MLMKRENNNKNTAKKVASVKISVEDFPAELKS